MCICCHEGAPARLNLTHFILNFQTNPLFSAASHSLTVFVLRQTTCLISIFFSFSEGVNKEADLTSCSSKLSRPAHRGTRRITRGWIHSSEPSAWGFVLLWWNWSCWQFISKVCGWRSFTCVNMMCNLMTSVSLETEKGANAFNLYKKYKYL